MSKDSIIVDSKVFSLKGLFSDKFTVDFYQREYVWEHKQLEDLIMDLSSEFLKNWQPGHSTQNVSTYDPYFMGEIVLSNKSGEKSAVIDGQQRITTLTLLLIYLLRTYGAMPKFPTDIRDLIYADYYGEYYFNLDIPERRECMLSLFNKGEYTVPKDASPSVVNLVNRYADIAECWDKRIDDTNIVPFVYWLKEKVMFSKVWTNSDEFAYVIFETMNDRGLSLTQIEMLRSYLLANTNEDSRDAAMTEFDAVIRNLAQVKLSSKSKAEFEFFKMYFRGHYADDLSQGNTKSDFVRIGKEFHRWVSENSKKLKLEKSSDFVEFIHRIKYFADVYHKINALIQSRNTVDYLYLIVNSDYGFTMQPAVIMSAVSYNDSDKVVDEKIKIVSRYLTKVLTYRVWNHWMISQSALEAKSYELCKAIRGMDTDALQRHLATDPLEAPALSGTPTLNQQNRRRFMVMISLITEIVASRSKTPDYPLNHPDIEVEHIWANHFEDHTDEFRDEAEFATARNSIGDLLVLPKSFNASYGDDPYTSKVEQYFSQNILAQTLNERKYTNNPGFMAFMNISGLPFKPYSKFTKNSISERTTLYRLILEDHWK
ncbi:DUF262 domain-containing protein [Fournierella massiliensis]|nr:DUF262 domain-containing protein [Fournierella massiliensis]MCF2556000.1 DUF262 domain-containing protein [Fournierella massiliensis]